MSLNVLIPVSLYPYTPDTMDAYKSNQIYLSEH